MSGDLYRHPNDQPAQPPRVPRSMPVLSRDLVAAVFLLIGLVTIVAGVWGQYGWTFGLITLGVLSAALGILITTGKDSTPAADSDGTA